MTLGRRSFLAGATALWTARHVVADARPVRIAVISDLNGSYGSTGYSADVDRAIAAIRAASPDLVICAGDMVAGQRPSPRLTEDEILPMWEAFHAQVSEPLAASVIPLLVTPGNHDASAYPGFERERQIFDSVWTKRAPDVTLLDGERYPFRYAASHRDVLFIGLDITVPGPLPVEETEWLAELMREEVPRHRACLVFGHLPIWPVARGRERDVIGDPAFEALLAQGGANLYLSGHHHAYYPFRSGGLLQVSQACLGSGPRRLLGTGDTALKGFGLIEVDAAGTVREQALAAPNFDAPIALTDLPDSISHRGHRIVRRDIPA